jgi:deazaflavin-dependent oxidoreductase (nitroreductase family)
MTLAGEYQPSTEPWIRDQVDLIERSNGTEGTLFRGKPVVVLTNRSAKTGKLRKMPLMRVEYGGVYAVVASRGGQPTHPLWYDNVIADPLVELQDGSLRQEMVAREVTGQEKSLWWERAVAAWPDYDVYQSRTERAIPVFVLEPTAAPGS